MFKRLISVWAFILIIASMPMYVFADAGVIGDVNGDGTLNNKDLTRMFQYLSDWDVAVVESNLDTNGDGNVNNKDLTRLFQYLSDWDVVLGGTDDSEQKINSFVYGKSEMGRDLVCYEIGSPEAERTIVLNFAIHGFEDEYNHDGQVLVDTAYELIEYYSEYDLNSTRLLIIPSANPDGLIDGTTNNGFGRCNANGVDLNRDFDANYVSYSNVRNYTPYAFSAAESRALRDLCMSNKPDIVLDFHGWLDLTIGDSELASVFNEEMGLWHQCSFNDSNARGYFANWAHQQGALGLLVEFTSSTSIDMNNLKNAINRLIEGDYLQNGVDEYTESVKYEMFENVKCFTLSDNRVTTYKQINVPFDTISYIDGAVDLCTIDKIYENGWVKVSYPILSGTKTAYCLLSDFIDSDYEVETIYTMSVSENTKVYTKSDMLTAIGTVYNTDTIYVVADTGTHLQIIYPIDTGGWKMGWIEN